MRMGVDKKGYYCFLLAGQDEGKAVDKLSNRSLWEGLKGNTTAHGIPHVNHAQGKTLF